MKKEKILAKAMITLFIDEEQKKLSDKLKDYKLSHNRKNKILKKIYDELKEISQPKIWYTTEMKYNALIHDINVLLNKIDHEISNPYLRHNWGTK